MLAAALAATATLAWISPVPSWADGTSTAGAIGEQVRLSRSDGAEISSGPLPAVWAPSPGGQQDEEAPSVSVGEFLTTGRLRVSATSSSDTPAAVAVSAAVDTVNTLAGMVQATTVESRCVTVGTDVTASTRLVGATLAGSDSTTALPADPAPNTTYTGTAPTTGEAFTVTLNDQRAEGGSTLVTALRVVLHGPSVKGEIEVAQSRCLPPAPPSAAFTADPVLDDRTTPQVSSGGESENAPAGDAGPTALESPNAEIRAAALPGRVALLAAADVSAVVGGAYGYFSRVGLFGGAPSTKGPEPQVTLPAGGSTTPITASLAEGLAVHGPATVFGSGPITVSTQGTTGPTGSVTSSTDIRGAVNSPPPFLYDRVRSTCTASEAATTGSTTINAGVVETKLNASGDPISTYTVPVNPAPNTEVSGTIDHVGDRFRIVFNEQSKAADGTLTVNAAHMYLLGPLAVGEVVIGQSRCGITVSAATATSTTTTAPPTSAAQGTSSTTAAGGTTSTTSASGTTSAGAADTSGSSGPTAVAAGARTGGQSGSGSGTPLAHTGGASPLLLALGLLTVALAARRRAARPHPEA
jgi:hypothetical protein